MTPVLDIKDLCLSFRGASGVSHILHDISLHIDKAERVALVGESGSGKSVTARIILGLLHEMRGALIDGQVMFDAQDIAALSVKQRSQLRGTEMSMIFQDPTSSLNPTFTIKQQFAEVLRRREKKRSLATCVERAQELLESVSINDPSRVLEAYPFQLSGGMNQRIMIAMALANNPKLLLADEPGTALDVSVQAQTLSLMHEMVAKNETAVLFISHNLGVVREFADRVYVMYRGRIVEDGPTPSIFADPRHAYTQALMSAVPRITAGGLPDVPEFREAFLDPQISHQDVA